MNPDFAPTLDHLRPEAVMAAATQVAAWDDFGADPSFIEGLSVYLDDLRSEARLNAAGIAAQFQDVVRLLSNRLGYERDLARHPEILDEKIEKPIVIFGLPRTGSSKLQRMIASDPRMQRLEVWRLLFPARLPGTEGLEPDPRIAIGEQFEQMMRTQFPELMAGHPMEAREPDEELWLLEMSFESIMSSLKTRAPKHRAFVESRSQRGPYAYVRKQLQYLQWQDGGAGGRAWVLKSPVHIGELQTVLATYPDAAIVHCHRDPRRVIPSYARLVEAARVTQSDQVDAHELGADSLAFWVKQTERNFTAREAIGESRILDVYYEDIRDRPFEVLDAVYAHADRELSPEARSAIASYDARRPADHFGAHRYTAEHFGLSDAGIAEAFAGYFQRFPRLADASLAARERAA